jgi:hypothetical protein
LWRGSQPTGFKWFLLLLRQTFSVLFGSKEENCKFYHVKRVNGEQLFKKTKH